MPTPARISAVVNPNSHINRGRQSMRTAIWPRPEEVREAREAAGLTVEQAAALVHTGGRAWSQWEADATSANASRMYPATWELFQAKVEIIRMLAAGKLTVEDVRRMKIYLPPLPGAGS